MMLIATFTAVVMVAMVAPFCIARRYPSGVLYKSNPPLEIANELLDASCQNFNETKAIGPTSKP